MTTHSVAMTGAVEAALRRQLIRSDGQEDVCVALYALSSGRERVTAIVREVLLPRKGERFVHGNASFTTEYVLRAATAGDGHLGVAMLHSHPRARRWQGMSDADRSTERSYANLSRELTGLPLLGMTIATGDGTWSARLWDRGAGTSVDYSDCENVRVLGERLRVSWNDHLRPPPVTQNSQLRTAHCWGDAMQADLARLRVLVVGAGSVGLTVAVALAATGIEHVAVMDFDTVKQVNLDRLLGATQLDALLSRAKSTLAVRLGVLTCSGPT